MTPKRWTILPAPKESIDELKNKLGIHPVLCKLLALRGVHNFEQAKMFFRTDIAQLHDPFLMKDMQTAVDRITQAIANNEKILFYGDYDVDGTTAVALIFSFFKNIYNNIEFYIPHRFTEGYGLSQKGVMYAQKNGFTLLITLDCGIKSVALIQEAKLLGIDTIVCDHHLPGEQLPDAIAILNPKQADCNYPYKELCGCGVAYKFAHAFALHNNIPLELVNENIDLLATAIAADIVPITGENRTLAVLGLEKANHNPGIPLQALKKISEMQKEFLIEDLVFIIAPRVNAAGRMDDARKAVELFLCKDLLKALELAQQLHADNIDRRDVDKSTTYEALDILQNTESAVLQKSTVVYKPHWHKGVVGIVASRLIEHYYRPTIVLTHSNGKLTGSGRSIKGVNLFETLNACSEYLENYGGHYFAAGLTLAEENLESFRNKFEEVIQNSVEEKYFTPEIEIDAEINLSDINTSFVNILKQFAPHGPLNMKPIFLTRNIKDYKGFSSVVKEKHLRLVVTQNGSQTFSGIGFNMGEKIDIVKNNSTFDLLYHIEENIWNGNRSYQLKLVDIRACS